MLYRSTRHQAPLISLDRAIRAGLAPDGGLYVPQQMPKIAPADVPVDASLAELAVPLLRPFFDGDAGLQALPEVAAEALDFAAPRTPLPWVDAQLLELFHGPTAAFKDFGARFLAACLRRMHPRTDTPLTILVATSGDTGAAVAAAFHGMPGFRVCILYPDGRVSPRQAHQLGCFGGNVQALRVAGTFDDCQRLVKQALNDRDLQARVPMSSANSISLGRLLPQMSYYAQAAVQRYRAHGEAAHFIIPTGNLGNALACAWVRAMGLPVGRIHLATNANASVPDFMHGQAYRARASVATLANAMDVGNPSNFERLLDLHDGDVAAVRVAFSAGSTDDATIRERVRQLAHEHQVVVCPHTATAVDALLRLREAGDRRHWILAATAHPAKFEGVVEPLVGHPVSVPPALAALLARPASAVSVAAEYAAVCAALREDWG